MQDILQQENGGLVRQASRHPPGWQQDSSVKASEDSQFSTGALGQLTPFKIEMKTELMRITAIFAALALVALTAFNASAQTPVQSGTNGPANSVDTDRIIRAFYLDRA